MERPSVLLVDADPASLKAAAAILAPRCDVTATGSARAAMALLEAGRFDVLCVDANLVDLNASHFLARVANLRRPIASILITGTREYLGRERRPDETSSSSVLFRPYPPEKLLEAVSTAARAAEMQRAASQFALGPRAKGGPGSPPRRVTASYPTGPKLPRKPAA